MLDRPSIPLHEQLRNILTHEIESGEYEDTGRLPVEAELGERFGVSRITVRRAVSELEEAGLVQRRQGRGTFVTPRPATVATMAVGGFSDQFLGEGRNSTRGILLSERIEASAPVAAALGIEAGAPVLRLLRAFRLEGLPIATDEAHYSLDRYPDFDTKVTDTTSTYKLLREEYGARFATVQREIGVGYTSARSAEWLERPENDPIIAIDKLVTDVDGGVIHTSRIECVPARMKLTVVATQQHDPATELDLDA
jgi:GntR family frlABCD operon transcriptional regulator